MSYLDSFTIPVPERAGTLEELFASMEQMNGDLTRELKSFCETIWAGEIPESVPEEIAYQDVSTTISHFVISPALQSRGYYARATKRFVRGLEGMELGTVLDPFAGSGYMVKALREAGIPTIATDDYSWKFDGPAEKIDALAAIRKYGDQINTVLLAWVPWESTIDMEIYQLLREEYPWINILVISEGPHGCTGSTEFAELHREWEEIYSYQTTWALRDYCAFMPGDGYFSAF
jgi:hypothetical protein